MKKLVSIIVPVYGVEKFIEKNMHSLLSQNYSAIEYIIVDDSSSDKSFSIIQKVLELYPSRMSSVHIIRHKENKGLPAARNSGLEHATGEYIFHCDSDDWIESNMIADLVESLENNHADIAYCDFYLSFFKNERYMRQPSFQDPEDAISAMLSGELKFNVWNKLVKSKLYKENHITFPEGRSMGEDMTMIKLFCNASKVTHLAKAYYHYVQTNPNSFTKSMSAKQLEDIQWNAERIISYIKNNKGDERFKTEVDYFKLNIKLPLLISLDSKLYNFWRNWFPEANYAIGKNRRFSFRVKLLQYAALYKLDWFVKAYNLIVIKFVYGVVYK